MSIIRVKKDKNYFAASNIPFNDKKLSWEARGVLGYLLSKREDWQVRFYDLVNQGPAGEHKMRRILKELEENNYLERERINKKGEDGKFDWVSTVYETPTIPRLPIDGSSTHGPPTCGASTCGKPRDIVSTEPTSTELTSTDIPSTEEEGNIFLLYESSIGLLTKNISDELKTLEDDYPKMWIDDAFAIAKKNKAKSLKYVTSILTRWNTNGKDDGYKPKGKKKTVDMSAFDRVREEMEREQS